MQTPAGHRTTIHSAAFREVGVGVVLGENTPPSSGGVAGAIAVGPSLVSQEFGSRHGDTPLITGVVYFDLNGNNFYDLGEGVGGVNVSVSGTTIQAVTARSGAYAVPVAGDGNYTVTFSAEGVPAFSQAVTISSLQNTKVDFRPVYSAPTLSGPESPAVDQPNSYTISPVPAAAGYQWRHFQLTTPVIEGAETGPSAVTASTFGAYELFDTAIKQSGGHSFHLMTPTGNIREQSFILNGRYLVNEGTILRFQSRLRLTTSTTFAIVQVSTNSGQSWHEVYRQAGATGSPGEASFQPRAANLSQYAGSILQVRFSFLPTGSSYIDADTGWFIDDIVVDGSSQIINQQLSQEIGTPGFQFQPTTEGNFVLQARGRTGHDYLPWGPMLHVQAVQGTGTPPTVQMSVISVENGRVIIEAEVEAGDVPSTWALESKDNLNEAWTTATTNFELVSPTRVRFDLLARAADKQQFYRVVTTQ
jgi:hypothetical protein